MITPRVLAKGNFEPDDVEVVYSEQSNLEITPEMAERIDVFWDQMVRDRMERGLPIWNAITCRINFFEARQNGKIKIEFAPLDFKTRECIIKIPGYYDWPEGRWRKGAFVCAFVRTSDDFYIFAALSGKSLNERKEEMIGGIVGDTISVRSGSDLFEVMYQELREEAAISREHVASCILKLAFLSPRTQIGFCFIIDANQTKAEIEVNFTRTAKDPDIKNLLFVSSAELEQQCQKMQDYKMFLYEKLFK